MTAAQSKRRHSVVVLPQFVVPVMVAMLTHRPSRFKVPRPHAYHAPTKPLQGAAAARLRFTSKKREPTGRHKFDVRCKALNIEHRLCPPRHPQTNGMVERFNGRISEMVSQTRFASAAELEATLLSYMKTYNQLIAQQTLKHVSPIQELKDWHAKKPESFEKRAFKPAGT